MPDADVAALLAASRAAHASYRQADRAGSGVAQKRIHIDHAMTARRDADAADPDHDEPEWGGESMADHDALMAFYESWLSRHPA